MWNEAERVLSRDKYIGPLIKKYGSCKIKPRVHIDYFQGLTGEIIGQQLSGRVADVIFERLKGKTRGRLTPRKLLALSDQDLRNCGMAWAKVRSIKDLAQRVKGRKLHIRKLNELPDDDLGIKKGMRKLLNKELKAEEMSKFALRWKPYRTVASWYLWTLLDNK